MKNEKRQVNTLAYAVGNQTFEAYNRHKKMTTLNTSLTRAIEIKDDTILLAIDLNGGMCDRLMRGRIGLVNNANASIECWNVDEDEKMELLKGITLKDIENAISILNTDNFEIVEITNNTVVEEEYIVGRNFTYPKNYGSDKCAIKQLLVDVDKVEFDENGIYRIL